MQLRTLLLGFILGLSPLTAMAGSDHDHGHSHAPVNQEAAKTMATKVVASLVKRDKLEKSWASITASSIEKKMFEGNSEWVAIFVNKQITEPAKQKLYIFLTLGGDYIAANYTGD